MISLVNQGTISGSRILMESKTLDVKIISYIQSYSELTLSINRRAYVYNNVLPYDFDRVKILLRRGAPGKALQFVKHL